MDPSVKSLRQRMAEARKNAGMTQQELARRLGLTAGAVGRWEAGYAIPELKRLQGIAELLNVSTDWLLGNADTHGSGMRDNVVAATLNARNKVSVPLFGTVAAGSGAVIEPGRTEEHVRVPPSIAGADFALRVKGESMQPLISERDVVYCRSATVHLPPFETDDLIQVPVDKVEPFKGKVCVVSINGEGFIKRLVIDKLTRGMYLAHFDSLNPQHRPKSLGREDDCRIQGVALGLWREL
jgi:SOS-response transcriptional repressor LexA